MLTTMYIISQNDHYWDKIIKNCLYGYLITDIFLYRLNIKWIKIPEILDR